MRRGPQEGSIFKRKGDGRWVSTITIGYDGDKRQRRTFYGRTRAEVARKLAGAQRTVDVGLPLSSNRETVAGFLGRWLEATRPALRPRTWRRYEQYVRCHAIPRVGRISLAKLTADDLQSMYADRLKAGLSPTTVRHLHAVMHKALAQAARWALVPRNIADLAEPPRIERHEMTTLTPAQVLSLIDAASSERLGGAVVLAVTTGLRQGELLGLHWRDLDLERGHLQVQSSLQWTKAGASFAEPKTSRSRRQITLSRVAVEQLRAHRRAQAEERLRRGAVWQDQDLVFANEVGGPVDPQNLVRRTFARTLAAAGLRRIRFHDLRHTAATLLLEQGVHPKIVSEMLGHSTIAMTLDLYSHVTPTMQRQAAEAMDAALSARP